MHALAQRYLCQLLPLQASTHCHTYVQPITTPGALPIAYQEVKATKLLHGDMGDLEGTERATCAMY